MNGADPGVTLGSTRFGNSPATLRCEIVHLADTEAKVFADARGTSAGYRSAAQAAEFLDIGPWERTVKHTIDVSPAVWARLADGDRTSYQGIARDGSLVPRAGDVVEFVDQSGWWLPGAENRDRLYFRVGHVTWYDIAGGPAVHWTASIIGCDLLAA
ncbi:MAG TPA: hypothetical protein VHV82_14605 [Sporichthyaceae bacterium]|nr:hypothetical protein [Sporichthyaceae bacterium]